MEFLNNHLTEAERIQDEDYNDWFGYSKIGIPPFCGESDGTIGKEETAQAQAGLGDHGKT